MFGVHRPQHRERRLAVAIDDLARVCLLAPGGRDGGPSRGKRSESDVDVVEPERALVRGVLHGIHCGRLRRRERVRELAEAHAVAEVRRDVAHREVRLHERRLLVHEAVREAHLEVAEDVARAGHGPAEALHDDVGRFLECRATVAAVHAEERRASLWLVRAFRGAVQQQCEEQHALENKRTKRRIVPLLVQAVVLTGCDLVTFAKRGIGEEAVLNEGAEFRVRRGVLVHLCRL